VSRRFETGIAGLQGLSLAVGIATAEALGDLGYAGIGLKWPNDLQVAGRKLGGILIEIGGDVSGPVRTAIGIGVNVAMPAAIARSLDQPWIDLATVAGGAPPSRNHLAAAVLARLLPALARFEREGLRPFLPAWSLLDVLAGREISVFEGQGMRSGRALGIEADGALRFECAGELIRLHGGEVSVRDANPAMMVSS
jgi:BirA family biotin operon repressor/biotin-[acetyl-CoA-carboxylase] ligase